jgi:hypothetical protein
MAQQQRALHNHAFEAPVMNVVTIVVHMPFSAHLVKSTQHCHLNKDIFICSSVLINNLSVNARIIPPQQAHMCCTAVVMTAVVMR